MGERKQFEYVRRGYEYANELGLEGWEAVGIYPTGYILFKRELLQEPETALEPEENWEWIEVVLHSRHRTLPKEETLRILQERFTELKIIDLGGWKDYKAGDRSIVMNVKVAK